MTRRTFLYAALAKPVRRPNIVFIFADQWRAQAFGYRGDPNARTPVIDALAKESFDFVNAVSGFPVCSPFRASLMTGQYAIKNGVVINDVELRPNGPTLGESFKKGGYETAYIGKWHIYGSPEGKAERRLTYIPEASRFGFEYWKTCECTHAYNRSLYYDGNDTTERYWEGYDAIAQTKDACEFVRKRANTTNPYLLMVSLGPPHDPYGTAPEKYQALYRDRALKLRPNVPADHVAEAQKNLKGYYSHMAAIDDCVGQLRDAVRAAGQEDDTVFIFTSDHGDMLESQGLHHKQQPWDESLRVPFLIRYPRLLGRKRRESITPIDAPDIMPTLLGLAGLPVPESAQGTNYAPLVAGKVKDAAEPSALLNLPASFSVVRRQGFAEYRGVRTPRYTYVRSIHGPWLLYDNQTDPYQMKNLVALNPELRSRMDRKLDAMLKKAGDEFLPGVSYVERAKATHYREFNAQVGHVKSPWGDWESTLKK
ncbi:MAG: sulfatase [Bryobacteraceae bacterium]|nr:sulfatase [Bryobacteraceae bacterium]